MNKQLYVLLAGLLAMSSMTAQAQEKQQWMFTNTNNYSAPEGEKIKQICLIDKTIIFAWRFELGECIGDQEVAAKLWVDMDRKIIYFDTHSAKNPYLPHGPELEEYAKNAPNVDAFLLELDREVNRIYLDRYNTANSIEAIDRFIALYKANDPDGYIPLLQSKKRDALHKQYKDSFENSSTSYQFQSFIKLYKDNDPDGLIPLAKIKLDEIEEQERSNTARMKAEKEAEKENEARQKAEKKAELERRIQASVIKYSSRIKALGFSQDFLKSSIYLQVDYVNLPIKFLKFEVWLAGLFESNKYSSITKIKTKNSHGVLLKRPGIESVGILFKMDNGDLFPSYLSNSEKAQPIESTGEHVATSMLIINAVTP